MSWDELYQDPRYCKRTPNPKVVDWLTTLPETSIVLDVGCGVGRHMDAIRARGLQSWGCDPSGVAVNQTNLAAPIPQAYIAKAQDMTCFGSDVFDAALCFAVLQYLPEADIPTALAEIHRVLRPNGQLMLVTRSVSDDRNFGKIPEAEADMPMVFLMKTEVEDLMRNAGFVNGIIGRMAIDWPGGVHDDDWVVFARKGPT